MDNEVKSLIANMNDTHWGDLTLQEIRLIQDKQTQREYLQKWNEVIRKFVNPLVGSSKFKFSTPDHLLTCRTMMQELITFYQEKGYTKEEIYQRAANKDTNKKR